MSAADPVSIKTFTSPATNNINVKSMFKTLSQNSFCTNGSPEASCFPHRLCQAITSQAKSLVQALRITYYGTPLHTGLTIVAHPATRGSTALKNGVTNVKLIVDFFFKSIVAAGVLVEAGLPVSARLYLRTRILRPETTFVTMCSEGVFRYTRSVHSVTCTPSLASWKTASSRVCNVH